MSDMSYKQAKELVDRLEITDLTLRETLSNINVASKQFQSSLKIQEQHLCVTPIVDKKLTTMKIIIALNTGFIIGIIASKYFL